MSWRPQISLLTLMLLMTTVALSVSLWQMGQDIVPLRKTVHDLREELGQFNVVEFDRVYIRRGETVTGSTWRWRLYLPEEFSLHAGEGILEELSPSDFANWKSNSALKVHPLTLHTTGQFTLELAVEEYGGKWWIKTATKNAVRGTTELKSDWYAELPKQVQYSDASYERVSITDATEPVVLLCVRRGEREQVGDTFVTKQVAGKAETLVLWLEPPPTLGSRAPQRPANSHSSTPRISGR